MVNFQELMTMIQEKEVTLQTIKDQYEATYMRLEREKNENI